LSTEDQKRFSHIWFPSAATS